MGPGDRRGGARQLGVSLPELMVVIALLALAVIVTVPIAANRVHELRLRSAAERFAATLRAQRMTAVTTGKPTAVIVHAVGQLSENICPPTSEASTCNGYAYEDARARPYCTWWPLEGDPPKCHTVSLPAGVWIEPGSDPSIIFLPNGALGAGAPATTVLKALLSGNVETWTVTTPRNGIPSITHAPGTPP